MIKIIFFDFDGVFTRAGHACSEICGYLVPVIGIAASDIEPVFHTVAKQLLVNGKRYKDYIDEINKELNTQLRVDDILNAIEKSELNTQMIEVLKDLQEKGIRVGMLTDNNVERLEMIRRHPVFGVLSPIIGSGEVGCTKESNEKIFLEALRIAKAQPLEAIFIDNKKECLAIPNSLGMTTYFHDEYVNDVEKLDRFLGTFGL